MTKFSNGDLQAIRVYLRGLPAPQVARLAARKYAQVAGFEATGDTQRATERQQYGDEAARELRSRVERCTADPAGVDAAAMLVGATVKRVGLPRGGVDWVIYPPNGCRFAGMGPTAVLKLTVRDDREADPGECLSIVQQLANGLGRR